MKKKKYNRSLRAKVVKEALRPEFKDSKFLIAEKYGIKESTVIRWKTLYLEYGDVSLTSGFSKVLNKGMLENERQKEILKEKDERIKYLEEELEITKKAAAFLAKVNRD
ncbi:MAG: hypothetical protein GXY87_06380 [Tissierellia bacterium]|nr:hypothetical protein [Tissierellia bacterium]